MKTAAIVGRLGRPLELETTGGGTAVVQFDLAVDFYDFQAKEKATEWISAKVFGQKADFLSKYASPGDRIAINGEMTFEKWESKKYVSAEGPGARMTRLVVVAAQDGVELLGKSVAVADSPRANPVPQPTLADGIANGEFKDIDFGGDDIPY